MTHHNYFFLRLMATAFVLIGSVAAGAASVSNNGLSASGAISDGYPTR
ncbi:Uncharacterised protein [Yersinia pseudotuberculosis]|nr:Uncharacterised protein [Yersinia pseudotuberculosis]